MRIGAAESEAIPAFPGGAGEPIWRRPTAEMSLEPAVFEAPVGGDVVVVTAVGAAEGSRAAAAALACVGAEEGEATLLVDLGGRAPRPTLIASASARALEERLVGHLPRVRVAARGAVCHLAAAAEPEGFETAAAATTVARGSISVVHVPPGELQSLLSDPASPRFSGALLRAEVDADRDLLALVVRDLLERELAVGVLKRRLGWVSERRALFGALGSDAEGISPSMRRLLSGGTGAGGRRS